tara:strand:- start:1168 stop:2316 length:1149 start_codon:yes stop_codon:yes gene_type:complete
LVKISSFKALIAEKEKIENFSIKSYIEYSRKEINQKLQENPFSYLNIISSDEKTQSNHFKKVAENLKKFKEKNILKTKDDSIYIYQQVTKKRTFTGLICGVSTNDYKNKKIKIHEKTIEKRENLFKEYLSKCKILAEPILLTYKKNEIIELFIQKKIKSKPYIKFKSKDKKEHILWKIDSTREISTIKQHFISINLYLADGHHRMASTFLYNQENKVNNNCLAYIISESHISLESFYRVIKDINQKQKLKLIEFLKEKFRLKKGKVDLLIEKNKINIYLDNRWHNISLINDKNQLMVQTLSEKILKPFFKIKNIRDSNIIEFVPESKFKLNKMIKSEDIVFCLPSIEIERIFQFANENKTMPPKSTYIRPKLRTGLLMMELK